MEKQYRFYNYKTYQAFLRDIDSIPEDAIVFIQDKLRIWTHGKEYVCDGPNMVVSDGEVITATGDEKTTTDGNTSANLIAGEKYIMMLLTNSTKLLYIPVNALYKDYTFNDTDEIDFTDNNNVISAEIKSGSVAKGKLSAAVQASLDLADSALQSHQDISGKADKVANATSGNFAGLDANGNITDSGKKASDFVAKTELQFATESNVRAIVGNYLQ